MGVPLAQKKLSPFAGTPLVFLFLVCWLNGGGFPRFQIMLHEIECCFQYE
jgi:hypothetical protein